MITVVVTTYSAPAATLAKCLQSVIEAGGADAVIVVDNGGLAHIPAHLAGSVELVRAAANHGFGAAANLGFARARQLGATAIALLNDDIEVEPGWLDALHDELVTGATGPAGAKPRVGAVQPKLLMAHSDPPMINSVGVRLDRYGAGQDIGFDEPDGPAFDIPTDIDIFTGGAVLFSTAFLDDLDGFDERYFMYYEDVDLALRGQRRGWVYRCAPASRVWHEGGVSADGAPAQRIFVTERNRIWCLFRFAGWRSMASGLGLAVRRTRHAPRSVHFRALVAGLRGGPRRLWERRAGGH